MVHSFHKHKALILRVVRRPDVIDVVRKRTQADVKSCEEEVLNDLWDNPLERASGLHAKGLSRISLKVKALLPPRMTRLSTVNF